MANSDSVFSETGDDGTSEQLPRSLFYEFRLDEAVPDDHLVRQIEVVLDLSWVYAELAPHYPTLGQPSIDPVLMIRMLIIGYVFGLATSLAKPV